MNTQSAQPTVPRRGTIEHNTALRVRVTPPVREQDYPHQQELATWLGQRTLGRAHKCTMPELVSLAKAFSREFGIDVPWHDIAHPRCTAILADTWDYVAGKRRRIADNCRAERQGNVTVQRPMAATPKATKPSRAGRPVCEIHFIQIPVGMDCCDECSDGHTHAPSQGRADAEDYLLADA